MESSSAFPFKRNPVYGLPTLWGGVMFLVIASALWFSISTRAPLEQWISFLMILLVLLHLSEANNPFRFLEMTIESFEAPFAGEPNTISILVKNPSNLPSEPLYFLAEGTDEWTCLPSLRAQGSALLDLPLPLFSPGKQALPSIRVKTRPASQLFQLWRVMRTEENLWVMPKAIDQGKKLKNFIGNPEEPELSHLEFIHDERLLFKMDEKIFLKTGKPYYRAHEKIETTGSIFLDWADLESLPPNLRGEQFSHWLKRSKEISKSETMLIHVDAPFFKSNENSQSLNWRDLKKSFAKWNDENA